MQSAKQLRCSSLKTVRSSGRRTLRTTCSATEVATCTPPATRCQLVKKFKSHDASITALAVLDDSPGLKRVITASLDKSLCTWTLEEGQEGLNLLYTRVEVAGGPVFSLEPGFKPKIKDPNTKQERPVMYCGLAAKEIAAWQPDNLKFSDKIRMNGHTGWVRSMSSSGKYLFSCGCNYLRQWDHSYAVPKEVSSTKLFTGDILAIACGDKRVFTAGADGSLRCWTIGKTGDLSEAAVREKAHDGRITALVVSGSLLYSAGYDGHIKAWDVSNLKLVMEVKAAHAGERVQALTLAPGSSAASPASSRSSTVSKSSTMSDSADCSDSPSGGADVSSSSAASSSGVSSSACLSPSLSPSSSPSSLKLLYSGGDDQLVRCWDARLMVPVGEPLQLHKAAVKALAAGDNELLVSGDAAGEVALWSV